MVDTRLMSEEEGSVERFSPAFESLVKDRGPDGAFREMCKLVGEPVSHQVRLAWQKKVGIVGAQAGPTTLKKKGLTNWYSGPSDDDRFWPALKRYLQEEKGWTEKTIASIDAESTGVMKLLPYPGGTVKAKGLVVGYVQSGKTANYTALIAKAADVGYRLIIVMAGVHNGLRRQTQQRLQAELVNVNTHLSSEWHTLTQPKEDFRATSTNTDAFLAQHSHQRILLVVKKNAHVLKRLVTWLNRGQGRLRAQCPALIIDDEADQAGLNTGRNRRSAVNAMMLELLEALPKSAYVGYTATPFANVLIDPSGKDLYPEDFIVSLPKPEGYFGTELFFGRDPLEDEGHEPPPGPDMFRLVEADEIPMLRPVSRKEVGTFTPEIPDSLRTAIRYFFLATAARWARGHRKKHSSMLIHTALNTHIHTLLAEAVQAEVGALKRALTTKKLRSDLEKLWSEEHPRVTVPGLAPVGFDSVWEQLRDVVARTKVVEDNGQSDERLVYKEELELTDEDAVAHIAVGGNTLSRGLTLEGLVVSYFVRSSTAYDTLLQMGRWFGYRFGYQDLPRLWMTEELQTAFHDLATVEEEIRRDIGRYEELGLTPKQFAVRIRTHPTLAITSRLKMQFAVKGGVNYAGLTRQTTKFMCDNDWLQRNWAAGGELLDELRSSYEQQGAGSRHSYFTGVPEKKIRGFLRQFQFHESQNDLRIELLEKYMDAQVKRGRCDKWTVAVASLKVSSPNLGSGRIGQKGEAFNLINRSVKKRRPPPNSVDLGTMTTQADFAVGLGDATRPTKSGGKKRQVNRPESSEPLLLLYPISAKSTDLQEHGIETNVLGVALAFPELLATDSSAQLIEYVHVGLPSDLLVDEEDLRPELENDDG